eukprot:scaffold2149_cov187-Cylindrotheca_fusiformis.AAC.1
MSLELNDDFVRVFTTREAQLRCLVRLKEQLGKQGGVADFSDRQVLRPLSVLEIDTLENACRCASLNWSLLRLLVNRNQQSRDFSSELRTLVSDTRFDGSVVFVLEDDGDVLRSVDNNSTIMSNLPPGIHSNLLVCDSVINIKSCRVYRNSFISKTYIGPHCTVVNCGLISTPNSCDYGKLTISVGPESGGGRNLSLTSEHTMIDVCRQLREGKTLNPVENPLALDMNVLSRCNILRDTPTLQNIYLHETATIEAASFVNQVTMHPNSKIGNSCNVSNCLLQWNSAVTDNSTASDTLLMEQAHCGPHGIVASSVMGPDVHTSAGEVHASVIGPNTNAHHQSLVIGVLWPLGRGNVGYGANVGSNHTGRLPDQETASGEGIFWGLSCVIKFPVDLTYSPYSIVAAGTTLPPQRVCMPFSLILEQPGGNQIIPGWVLQSSPYTLARSEKKFATRRKAERHGFYTGWKIQRQEIIDMCRWARDALRNGGTVQGIGENVLTERAREVGIRAYTDCIQRYALHGLLSCVQRLMNSEGADGIVPETALQAELSGKETVKTSHIDPANVIDWPQLPWDMKGQDEWEFQRTLLLNDFPMQSSNLLSWVEDLLKNLVQLESDYARRIHKSKSRDDSRGAKTIPGYAKAHISADEDPVIIEARKNADEIGTVVTTLLRKLSPRSRL